MSAGEETPTAKAFPDSKVSRQDSFAVILADRRIHLIKQTVVCPKDLVKELRW